MLIMLKLGFKVLGNKDNNSPQKTRVVSACCKTPFSCCIKSNSFAFLDRN